MLYFTIPNCSKLRWENFFMLTFLLSTVWIAIFSYVMVWMVGASSSWGKYRMLGGGEQIIFRVQTEIFLLLKSTS